MARALSNMLTTKLRNENTGVSQSVLRATPVFPLCNSVLLDFLQSSFSDNFGKSQTRHVVSGVIREP